jgi:predicted ATPase
MVGVSHHLCGDQALAQEHLDEGMRLSDASGNVRNTFFGYDHRVRALVALCRALWLRGLSDSALEVAQRAVDEASTLNQPVDVCISLIYGESVFMWRGDWDEARRVIDMLREHAQRHSLSPYQAVALALEGELLVKTDRAKDGCRLLQQATSTLKAERHTILATVFAGALAEGLAATGAIAAALATLEEALAEARRRGATFDLPELLRMKAAVLAMQSPSDDRAVDELLSEAIELARRQGALAWELRALTTLAREKLKRGARGDHLKNLSAVCAKLTEGLQTADLRAARDLLERRRS